jgi:hypothetical protein
VIVFAYGQILRPAFLELPEKGCYNLHASLLPRHRGAACIQAAILDGDPITGLTLMKVAEGLDTGDICLQRKLEIIPGETAGELHDRIADLGPDLLIQGLEQLAAGTLPSIPQEEDRASYARGLKKKKAKSTGACRPGRLRSGCVPSVPGRGHLPGPSRWGNPSAWRFGRRWMWSNAKAVRGPGPSWKRVLTGSSSPAERGASVSTRYSGPEKNACRFRIISAAMPSNQAFAWESSGPCHVRWRLITCPRVGTNYP